MIATAKQVVTRRTPHHGPVKQTGGANGAAHWESVRRQEFELLESTRHLEDAFPHWKPYLESQCQELAHAMDVVEQHLAGQPVGTEEAKRSHGRDSDVPLVPLLGRRRTSRAPGNPQVAEGQDAQSVPCGSPRQILTQLRSGYEEQIPALKVQAAAFSHRDEQAAEEVVIQMIGMHTCLTWTLAELAAVAHERR